MRAAKASRRYDPCAPRTNFAQRSASRSEVASPIQLLAPVMATTLSSIHDEFCIVVSLLLVFFSQSFAKAMRRSRCGQAEESIPWLERKAARSVGKFAPRNALVARIQPGLSATRN